MSNSNAASRTAPKITLSDKPEEDFNFYLQFVTPLVPKLLEEKERRMAAEWVKKLVEDKRNPKLRAEYLLLLLFALQRRHLSGPFLSFPSATEPLQPFEDNLDMFQMMERMAKHRSKPKVNPPYYAEVSGDFKDYVVTQEIPDFGVHCYLATSNEPIQKWKNAHLAQIPKESTAEAFQIGSGSCFETVPVQRGSSQFTPPTPPAAYEEMIVADREERLSEYSVNLQALQGLIPSADYISNVSMPSGPPSFTDYQAEREASDRNNRNAAPSGTQGVPIGADNPPPASYSDQFELRIRRSQENISSGEMERLMAEFEEKLRPEMSDESTILGPTRIPQPTNRIPRARPVSSQTGSRATSNASSTPPVTRRVKEIPIRKPKY